MIARHPLSDHRFAQRFKTLGEILEADGELVDAADIARAATRYVRLEVSAPGYELPPIATFEYEELYARSRTGWSLSHYQYEIRFDRRAFGRKAYHWHDGLHHLHCTEHQGTTDDHFRGYEMDLLRDARPDLLRVYAVGSVDCSGLHALIR